MVVIAIVASALLACSVYAQSGPPEESASPAPIVGYVDADRDGVNDRFRDRDGDGVNDLNGQSYPHHFPFLDEDEDGVNDRFRDQDGDGVNDLDGRFRDQDGDGFIDNVVDFNGDRLNDITGAKYGPHGLLGYRFGRIFEERRHQVKQFRDADGDGMHDPLKRLHQRLRAQKRRMDFFLDEDGDGIDDARLLRRLLRHPDERVQDLTKKRLKRRRVPPHLKKGDPKHPKKKGGK